MVAGFADVASKYARVQIDLVLIALLCSAAGGDAIEERMNVFFIALAGDSRNGNWNYGV
mgnify:CR=1 FL=1|jgi:hypothetical protein